MTSRKPDEWMPLDVRKYLGDTMHLSRDQHGAYFLLIMAYWMRGEAGNDNDHELAAIAKATLSEWRKLRAIIAPFFQIRDGKWFHKKIEEELARARKFIERKAEAGRQGAEKRWRTNGEPNGSAMAHPLPDEVANECLEDAPLPSTSTSKEEEKRNMAADAAPARKRASKHPDVEPEGFAEFYEAYPRKVDRPDAAKAYRQALKKASPAELLAGAKRYAIEKRGVEKEFLKQPAGWLRGERWKDESANNVIRPSFVNAEEQEAQRLFKEKLNAQAAQ